MRARKRNHGSASGDPSTPDDDYGHRCSCESNKRGCNRRSSDGDSCKPPSSRPERRDVPFHDRTRAREAARAAPGRGGAPRGRERDRRGTVLREPPRGGHLETGPSADALRLLRQGELSERRPLPLRPH